MVVEHDRYSFGGMMAKYQPADEQHKEQWQRLWARVMKFKPPIWLHILKWLNACLQECHAPASPGCTRSDGKQVHTASAKEAKRTCTDSPPKEEEKTRRKKKEEEEEEKGGGRAPPGERGGARGGSITATKKSMTNTPRTSSSSFNRSRTHHPRRWSIPWPPPCQPLRQPWQRAALLWQQPRVRAWRRSTP
jgi:hypothetical protein